MSVQADFEVATETGANSGTRVVRACGGLDSGSCDWSRQPAAAPSGV